MIEKIDKHLTVDDQSRGQIKHLIETQSSWIDWFAGATVD